MPTSRYIRRSLACLAILTMAPTLGVASEAPRPPAKDSGRIVDIVSRHKIGPTLDDLARANRAVVTALPDVELEELAGSDEPTTEPRITRTITKPGDLTGDGAADLLVMKSSVREETVRPLSLEALGGTDGRVLWSMDLEGMVDAYLLPVQGASNEGRFLFVRLSGTDQNSENCVPVACARTKATTFRWDAGLLDARDGTFRWSRSYEGAFIEHWPAAGALVTGANNLTLVQSALLIPFVERGGVAINVVDIVTDTPVAYASAPLAYGFTYTTVQLTRTASEVVDEDGGTTYTRASDFAPELSVLRRPGDIVGGADRDHLWTTERLIMAPGVCAGAGCAWNYIHQVILEAVDGATGTPAWSRTFDDRLEPAQTIEMLGVDVNGDEKADLSVLSNAPATHVLDGATGNTLWTYANDTSMYPIADISGDGLADVALVHGAPDYSYGSRSVQRRSGRDGTVISSTSLGVGRRDEVRQSEWDDVDGDGSNDLWIQTHESPNNRIVSSRSDSVLADSGYGEWIRAGDLNGDGRGDLLTVRYENDWGWGLRDVRFTAVDLQSRQTIWTTSVNAEVEDRLTPVAGGRLLAGAGDDIVVLGEQERDGVARRRLAVLDGANGAEAWSIGDEFLPPAPRGSISGRVTDTTGAALGNTLILFHDGAGNSVRHTYSWWDGSYDSGSLRAGEYRVLFRSQDDQFTEWFDDVASFDDATPVVVSEGPTEGIDAQLG